MISQIQIVSSWERGKERAKNGNGTVTREREREQIPFPFPFQQILSGPISGAHERSRTRTHRGCTSTMIESVMRNLGQHRNWGVCPCGERWGGHRVWGARCGTLCTLDACALAIFIGLLSPIARLGGATAGWARKREPWRQVFTSGLQAYTGLFP